MWDVMWSMVCAQLRFVLMEVWSPLSLSVESPESHKRIPSASWDSRLSLWSEEYDLHVDPPLPLFDGLLRKPKREYLADGVVLRGRVPPAPLFTMANAIRLFGTALLLLLVLVIAWIIKDAIQTPPTMQTSNRFQSGVYQLSFTLSNTQGGNPIPLFEETSDQIDTEILFITQAEPLSETQTTWMVFAATQWVAVQQHAQQLRSWIRSSQFDQNRSTWTILRMELDSIVVCGIPLLLPC